MSANEPSFAPDVSSKQLHDSVAVRLPRRFIAAGGDGTLRPIRGAAIAIAGWAWGGVMRRADAYRRGG